MTALRKRVATCICCAGMTDPVAEGWEPEKCVQRAEHLEAADAAIAELMAALAEPSEAMVREAETAIFKHMANSVEWTLEAARDGIKAAAAQFAREIGTEGGSNDDG